ncbi:ParB N-terminal domain-containing protein [Mahella sp.]|uniref:ParB N-terminal domain-containing protein n=1 Tax=Mahella sp. TaxID=2798721 RepID=UPI0025C53114|nr:ParB N-terminal domain-containing protein [Mahella sp.]MBZ4666843.1 ParB domain protein nuclease [Mahella sp.]
MAKARIHLEGLVPQNVKSNEDEVRFKWTSTAIIEQQKKQNVNYIIKVSRTKWLELIKDIKDDDILVVEGEPYLGMTSKGVPYIEVNTNNIFAKQFVPQEDISYFRPEEIEEVPLAHIDLVEPVHLNAKPFSLEPNITNAQIIGRITMPLTVRILPSGRLGLVSGLKNYLVAKQLGFKTVPVIFRNMTNLEWLSMRGIDPQKSFEWRHSKIRVPGRPRNIAPPPRQNRMTAPARPMVAPTSRNEIKEVPLVDITVTNPKFTNARLNPQKTMAEKERISKLGKIDEPLLVRQTVNGKYDLVDGFRRLTIAKELGFDKVPVKVVS